MGVLVWFERRSTLAIMVFAVVWIAVIGVIDYETGYQISVGAFYLVAIVVPAWCCGRWAGWAAVLLAVAVWFVAEVCGRPADHPKILVYWNTVVRLIYFLPVMWLAVNLRERLLIEEQSARSDPLTGAHNTRSFFAQFELELARQRRRQESFALVYMDLDNFKQVNDACGHGRGDRLLRDVVSIMRLNLRPTDIVGRLGGDEFAVLMPLANREQAETAISRLREKLLGAMREEQLPVTFSIGVVSFEDTPVSPEEAVRLADGVMYEAKRGGKDRIGYRTYKPTSPST